MKVLSIDFDYIMSPCIKLYNNYVCGDENATVQWNDLESRLDISSFLSYDANSLIEIASLILRNVKNGAKFISIKEHQEIIPAISHCDDIELVNIDFHHDIMYGPVSKVNIADFDKYSCADWVGYLFMKKKLSSYTWIKAPQSDPYYQELMEIDYNVGSHRDIKDLPNDFDYVVFCLSPQWVPYRYQHLYDLIVRMAEEVVQNDECPVFN